MAAGINHKRDRQTPLRLKTSDLPVLILENAILTMDGQSQAVRPGLVSDINDFQVRSGQSLLAKAWPLINFRPTELANALSALTGPSAPKPGRSSLAR